MKEDDIIRILISFFTLFFIIFSHMATSLVSKSILKKVIGSEVTNETENGIYIWSKLITDIIICCLIIILLRKFLLNELIKIAENPIKFVFSIIFCVLMLRGCLSLQQFLSEQESVENAFVTSNSEDNLRTNRIQHPVKHIISTCLLGPFFEEIVYRYLFYMNFNEILISIEYVSQNIGLKYISSIFLALTTSLAFGLDHLSIRKENFIQVLPYFLSGLNYLIIYEVTGFFFVAVIAHMLENLDVFYHTIKSLKDLKYDD